MRVLEQRFEPRTFLVQKPCSRALWCHPVCVTAEGTTSKMTLMTCAEIICTFVGLKEGCYRLAAKSCPTLCDTMDCILPDSSVHGISPARILEWVFPSPRDLSNPGIKPASPALAGGFFTTKPPGKPSKSVTSVSKMGL